MRHLQIGLGLALLLPAGCNTFPMTRGTGAQAQPVARTSAEVPSKEAIIAYLNDNANRVQSLRCKDLDIGVKQGMQSVGLRGKVVCAKPRGFRLDATILGKQEVDVGSNEQEFWFWMARNNPPHLFHCKYDDLSRGQVQMPFPFQPEWIMEAMGLAECGPAENAELKVNPTTLELVERAMSPTGMAVRKVTVIQRTPAQGPAPQVAAHILQDAQGKELVSAHVTEVQFDRATGAIIPKKVRLVCPSEKLELKLQFDDVQVNDPSIPQIAGRLFTRPNLSNVTSYDLARGVDPGPNGIRRIGGQQLQR